MNVLLLEEDISVIESEVLQDGKIKVMPYSFYRSLPDNTIKLLMLNNGIYVLPTQELIDWLKENIIGNAIEIGAGIGTIARALGIPITDSRMQERPEIRLYYQMAGQPPIRYANDVEKLDAEQAIIKYNPDTVIGCFITHKFDHATQSGSALGVQEEFILKNVQRYINVGNLETHNMKPILKMKPKSYNFDWLITRSADKNKNRIWVHDK